jgi:hypothetical protein
LESSSRPGQRFRLLLLAGIYLLAALPVTFVFLMHPGLTGHPDADFTRMVDGTASRPYVTRALVPFVIRSLSRAIPDAERTRFEQYAGDRRMVELFGWEHARLAQYAIASVLFVVCFAGFAFVLRCLARRVYVLPPALGDLAPLVALAALPLCFRYYSYVYDPATLLLFSLGVLFIVEERTIAFLLILALAALNKETSVLLVAVYAWRLVSAGRGGVLMKTACAFLLWGVTRVALELASRDRPGALVEWHADHTRWLFDEWPGRFWYALTVAAIMAVVVVPGWRRKPRFLRGGLLITLVPLVIAALCFGFADELRGYQEAAPFIFLLALPTLARAMHEDVAPR